MDDEYDSVCYVKSWGIFGLFALGYVFKRLFDVFFEETLDHPLASVDEPVVYLINW